jgi:hypothetical protein
MTRGPFRIYDPDHNHLLLETFSAEEAYARYAELDMSDPHQLQAYDQERERWVRTSLKALSWCVW